MTETNLDKKIKKFHISLKIETISSKYSSIIYKYFHYTDKIH